MCIESESIIYYGSTEKTEKPQDDTEITYDFTEEKKKLQALSIYSDSWFSQRENIPLRNILIRGFGHSDVDKMKEAFNKFETFKDFSKNYHVRGLGEARFIILKKHFNQSYVVSEKFKKSKTTSIDKMTPSELYSLMNSNQKDSIYRMIWKEHVKDDVDDRINDLCNDDYMYLKAINNLTTEEYNTLVDKVADKYVHGRYDCNLSYWENIDNLINEEVHVH